MHSIPVPDQLYVKTQRVAAASGLTVEAYFQEALELLVDEDGPIRLTPDQAVTIAKAEAEIDAGNFFTSSEVREYFNQK